jgi:hypothetical protein
MSAAMTDGSPLAYELELAPDTSFLKHLTTERWKLTWQKGGNEVPVKCCIAPEQYQLKEEVLAVNMRKR